MIWPADRLAPGELGRWRSDLISHLGTLQEATRRGAGEAYLLRRLEGLGRALEYRLEQARRG